MSRSCLATESVAEAMMHKQLTTAKRLYERSSKRLKPGISPEAWDDFVHHMVRH